MDSEHIEQLLQRYWQCQTSVEEEQELRDYFVQTKDLPKHLMQYKELFAYQSVVGKAQLGEDFDKKILSKIEASVTVKARKQTVFVRLMPMFKAAAAIAAVLAIGNVIQTSLVPDMPETTMTDSIGNVISAPSVALGGSQESDVNMTLQQKGDSLLNVENSNNRIVGRE